MSIAIDLALIIFIILSVGLSSKRGFVYSLLSFIGYIFAALFGFAAARAGAEYLTNGFFREKICDRLYEQLSTDTVDGILDALNNALPKFVMRLLNIDNSKLYDYIGQSRHSAAEAIFDNAISPILNDIIKTLLTILLLGILFFIVRKIAFGAKRLIRHTFLRSVDVFFGALLGFAKSVIIIICTMYVIKFFMMIGGGQVWRLDYSVIDASMLFRFFYRRLLSL